MNNIAAVSFKENGKLYFFDGGKIKLNENTFVVVETERGLQLGKVIVNKIRNVEHLNDIKKIIRIADSKDTKRFEINKKDAYNAMVKARNLAEKYSLNMNIVDASYTLDRSQLIFFFLSDQRVDFRDLAKDLAAVYKTRIELRQIGVRDKAKDVGGIGQCGKVLCCASFLHQFPESVSINMAKNQNLTLNPTKINGQCGRLLCCLTYEDDIYTENREGMPLIGDKVKTEKGEGTVISVDVLKRSYVVNVEAEGKVVVNLGSKCDECGKCNK